MKLVAGNWKMNGLLTSRIELDVLLAGLDGRTGLPEIVICPPATILQAFAKLAAGSRGALGGQYCHPSRSGAHTGDISAEMLKDAGASYVLVGHSERRIDHAETSAAVASQAVAAYGAGLSAIICIGESDAQHQQGKTAEVLSDQIAWSIPDIWQPHNTSIAYEPIWAIGTGKTATLTQIEQTHEFIRSRLMSKLGSKAAGVRVLYGGSVKPSNAREILHAKGVDGVLVGGASLKAQDYLEIIDAARVH